MSTAIVRVPAGRSKSRDAVWKVILHQGKTTHVTKLDDLVVYVQGHYTAFNNQVALNILKQGISSRAINPLSHFLGVPQGEMAVILDLDRTTARRRAEKDLPLPMHSAENVLRVLELEEMAADTFESEEAALGWLRRPHPMLEGESPLEAAKTSFGARRVKEILVAIKHGGVV